MLACAFFESAGLCQNTYSDVWLVGSSPSAVMAGCAVTDESYFGYNHEFYITTTITSPGGRTATGYGGNGGCSHSGSPECGQANVSLPVTYNGEWELGDDAKGNWVKEIKSAWNSKSNSLEPVEVTYRIITYY